MDKESKDTHKLRTNGILLVVQRERFEAAVLQSVPKVEVLRKELYEATLGPRAFDVVRGRFRPVGTVWHSSSRDSAYCNYQMHEVRLELGVW